MCSAAQALAHRSKTRTATGSDQSEGRRTTRRHALKHGLASNQIVITGESQKEFDRWESALVSQYQPTHPTEMMLVQEIARHYWLAQRAIRLQNEAWEQADGEVPTSLPILIRYQTTNERACYQAMSTLATLRREETKENGVNGAQAQKREEQLIAEMFTGLMMSPIPDRNPFSHRPPGSSEPGLNPWSAPAGFDNAS
jgi:hypothetical protein